MLPTDPAILILEVLGFTAKDFDLFVALGQGCTCWESQVRPVGSSSCQRCRLLRDHGYSAAYLNLKSKGLIAPMLLQSPIKLSEEGQAIFDGIYKPKGKKHEEEGSG